MTATAKVGLVLLALGLGSLCAGADLLLEREFEFSPIRGNPMREALPLAPPLWVGYGLVGIALAAAAARRAGRRPRATLLVGLLSCLPLAAAAVIPSMMECRCRKGGNEPAAIGALETLRTAQALHREGDKDGDEVFDYGDLQELSDAQLIDRVLGAGTKHGYVFTAQASSQDPEFLWFATASPAIPGVTGERYFCTNQSGVVFYTTSAPFQLDPKSCLIPPHAVPVGK